MWVSGKWKDYELIDCSGGERLERWGAVHLIRPDPQVIWNTPKTHPMWQKAGARYVRSSTGGGQWRGRDGLPEKWEIAYGGLRFHVKPMNFKHTGIFPEQAANWDFISERIEKSGRAPEVLNLFGYTGAATLAAARASAKVCHVDAARGMVSWGRENQALSGLSDAPVRWIVDDCAKFVRREIARGRRYDAIIMDPPSYGRGPTGEIWKLEQDLYPFFELCVGALSDDPLFVVINSYTTGLAPSVLSYLMGALLVKRFGGEADCGELGLPVSQSGLVLPCGASGRWARSGI